MSGGMKKREQPHVGVAVVAAGGMALALALGLKWLGLMGVIDRFFLRIFSPEGMKVPELSLMPGVVWTCAGVLSFLLPAVILNVAGVWRRLFIWGGTVVLTVSWGPVLVLAARVPEIGVALVAVMWSGFCAMFYTIHHELPVDVPETPDREDAKS